MVALILRKRRQQERQVWRERIYACISMEANEIYLCTRLFFFCPNLPYVRLQWYLSSQAWLMVQWSFLECHYWFSCELFQDYRNLKTETFPILPQAWALETGEPKQCFGLLASQRLNWWYSNWATPNNQTTGSREKVHSCSAPFWDLCSPNPIRQSSRIMGERPTHFYFYLLLSSQTSCNKGSMDSVFLPLSGSL